MTTHIMLDLETMGKSSDAAITAIGAVWFDKTGEIDPSTVVWWLKQNPAAQLEMTKPGDHIMVAHHAMYDAAAQTNHLALIANTKGFELQ